MLFRSKPMAMRFIHDTAMLLKLDDHNLSGIGGVSTWRDALDFIRLGCSNVQVCTAVMQYGYRIIDELCEGLQHYLAAKKIYSLNDLLGIALTCILEPSQLDRKTVCLPAYNKKTCVGCGRCYISCKDGGHQAISVEANSKPIFNMDACVGCHLCRLVCPTGAITPGERINRVLAEA